MCLIVFSYQQHPQYDLIFAANRDEHYERPTRSAQFWDEYPNILAGKDQKAGGTWMGINREGAFAALTNYRDPSIQKSDPPSRGHLVLDYLKKGDRPEHYLQSVSEKAEQYMGFNLLTGTLDQLYYYSNLENNILQLEPGLYGLSNHLLDTSWPKVEKAKGKLEQILRTNTIDEASLFELLSNDQEAPENKLPNTGIPLEIEKKVSPIFIKSDGYGTRCSTVLLIDKRGKVTFTERRFKAGSMNIENENRYQFLIKD